MYTTYSTELHNYIYTSMLRCTFALLPHQLDRYTISLIALHIGKTVSVS